MRRVVLALLVAACGDDDDEPVADSAPSFDSAPVADAGPPDGPPADAATSGKLTINASGITGANGKIALIGVPGPGGFAAVICQPIAGDPASVSAVAKVQNSMMNPCDLGADAVLDNGTYQVSGGIYVGGSMTPEQCSETMVEVIGDTTVDMPAFVACP